jgi:hypothetical protein
MTKRILGTHAFGIILKSLVSEHIPCSVEANQSDSSMVGFQTSNFTAFIKQLNTYKKPKSRDQYDDRVTHCYMTIIKDGILHNFEVRGWGHKSGSKEIFVSAVNWTICAGPCSITITKENVLDWTVWKDFQITTNTKEIE